MTNQFGATIYPAQLIWRSVGHPKRVTMTIPKMVTMISYGLTRPTSNISKAAMATKLSLYANGWGHLLSHFLPIKGCQNWHYQQIYIYSSSFAEIPVALIPESNHRLSQCLGYYSTINPSRSFNILTEFQSYQIEANISIKPASIFLTSVQRS